MCCKFPFSVVFLKGFFYHFHLFAGKRQRFFKNLLGVHDVLPAAPGERPGILRGQVQSPDLVRAGRGTGGNDTRDFLGAGWSNDRERRAVVRRADRRERGHAPREPELRERVPDSAFHGLDADDLEGRGVGLKGLDAAADYIRNEFSKVGLKLDSVAGGSFQTFAMSTGAALGPVNTLEFKLVDASGENVWWYNQRNVEFPTTWTTFSRKKRQISFAWGPLGGGELRRVAAIEIAERHHLHKPVMEQPEYNLFKRERFEREYARLFKDYGYGSTTWSPLASGLLTGKYNNGIPKDSRAALKGYDWLREGITEEKIHQVRKLARIAKEVGATPAQFAIAWCARNEHVSTVITGASRVEQVHENLKALEVLPKLTDDVLAAVDKIVGKPNIEKE